MKRSELEKYLGKTVKVTLFNGDAYTGELHKTGGEQFRNYSNLYLSYEYYFLINTDLPLTICCQSCMFKSSHVIKIEEV